MALTSDQIDAITILVAELPVDTITENARTIAADSAGTVGATALAGISLPSLSGGDFATLKATLLDGNGAPFVPPEAQLALTALKANDQPNFWLHLLLSYRNLLKARPDIT